MRQELVWEAQDSCHRLTSIVDSRVNKVKSIGRRRWKKTSHYHQQARVENAFFRYKSIIGDGLRARTPGLIRTGRPLPLSCTCRSRRNNT